MSDIVICEPPRSPAGPSGGVLAALTASELATTVLTELVRGAGRREGDVGGVILGQRNANGSAATNMPALT